MRARRGTKQSGREGGTPWPRKIVDSLRWIEASNGRLPAREARLRTRREPRTSGRAKRRATPAARAASPAIAGAGNRRAGRRARTRGRRDCEPRPTRQRRPAGGPGRIAPVATGEEGPGNRRALLALIPPLSRQRSRALVARSVTAGHRYVPIVRRATCAARGCMIAGRDTCRLRPRAPRPAARRSRSSPRLIKRHGACGLAAAQRADHFSALVRAITNQQLSTKAAATIYGRLTALMPGGTPTAGGACRG